MDDTINATNNLLINAGVIGAVALILIIGGGYLLYLFGGRLCNIADRFVTGTLTNMANMVTQLDNHGEVMKEISTTQKEIHRLQVRLSDRVEDLYRKP